MLSFEDFKQVTLEDKPIFDKHYTKYQHLHSDNVFTTIISWQKYANYQYALAEDNLIIMSTVYDKSSIRPPIGKQNKDLFQQVLALTKQLDSPYPLTLINQDTKNWIEKQYPALTLEPNRDFYDYIYLASDLATLPGSAYSKIRNRLNKFTRNYQYTTEKITTDNLSEIKTFLRRWCLWKDCDSDPLLENEKKAIQYSMNHFLDLELSGILIRINDNIEAIAVYENMGSDMVVVHYEKGSPEYDGIYKAINTETAKIVQNEVTYMDREPDMGIPGLRKAKLSYRPHHMIEVFQVEKQNIADIP